MKFAAGFPLAGLVLWVHFNGPLSKKSIRWCERKSGRFYSWNLALLCQLANPEQVWFYLDMCCMSASSFREMTCLLAWQLLDALSSQTVALNWLQFSVFLGQWHWVQAVQAAPQALPRQEGLLTAAGGAKACPCSWIKSYACSFKTSVNKWWRMLDEIVAVTCERGRDPYLFKEYLYWLES